MIGIDNGYQQIVNSFRAAWFNLFVDIYLLLSRSGVQR